MSAGIDLADTHDSHSKAGAIVIGCSKCYAAQAEQIEKDRAASVFRTADTVARIPPTTELTLKTGHGIVTCEGCGRTLALDRKEQVWTDGKRYWEVGHQPKGAPVASPAAGGAPDAQTDKSGYPASSHLLGLKIGLPSFSSMHAEVTETRAPDEEQAAFEARIRAALERELESAYQSYISWIERVRRETPGGQS